MLLENIILFISGLGVFLVGCKFLSDNIGLLANRGLKNLFNKSSKNKLVGVGIGAATTAVIQSSSATTVLVVGLVNAGIMSLFQATTVIMGANIGTTITAQIVALKSFDIALYAMTLALIGIFMNMLAKKEKMKTLGIALSGLGMIFIGLELMGNSMDFFSTNGTFESWLKAISNPILLMVIGAIFTAIIQSSSAATSILITMAASGLVIGSGGNSILYVVLGTNIGTCITALLSSIGATANAKRASAIHFMFNLFGSVLFAVILLIWKDFMDDILCKIFAKPETQVAMFHTLFNVTCTLIFLPITSVFVKLSQKLIPDKKEKISHNLIKMDARMLEYPSVALGQLTKEISRIGYEAVNVFNLAIDDFLNRSDDHKQDVKEANKTMDLMNKEIIEYLVLISGSQISLDEEKMISSFHHNLNDLLRIGEIADNITKYTDSVINDALEFSDAVIAEIGKMKELINELYKLTDMTFISRKLDLIPQILKVEDSVDDMRAQLVADHLARLKAGKCQPQSSGVFINLVNNLERAADHLTYIAESV